MSARIGGYLPGMSAAVTSLAPASPSFYGPVAQQDDVAGLMDDYRGFLERRNGRLALDGFERRHAEVATLDSNPVRFHGTLENERMLRLHRRLESGASEAELLVLCLHDINAAEEYGVQVTSAAREHLWLRDDPLLRLERWLGHEETFHSKLLKGSAVHFGVELPSDWQPQLSHKVVFEILKKAPPSIFHPVLLAAEVTGLFVMNWLLKRIEGATTLRPELRWTLQERVLEVMVDEVGHVAFNRAAMGPTGMAVSQALSRLVIKGLGDQNKALVALGMNDAVQGEIGGFDFMDLPAEVRAAGFFA